MTFLHSSGVDVPEHRTYSAGELSQGGEELGKLKRLVYLSSTCPPGLVSIDFIHRLGKTELGG